MLVCRPNTFYDMCGSKILIIQSVLLSVCLKCDSSQKYFYIYLSYIMGYIFFGCEIFLQHD